MWEYVIAVAGKHKYLEKCENTEKGMRAHRGLRAHTNTNTHTHQRVTFHGARRAPRNAPRVTAILLTLDTNSKKFLDYRNSDIFCSINRH